MSAFPYFEITGPEKQQLSIEIKTDRLTIGRLEQWNDLALFPDPQQLISRKTHCTIEYLHHAWWVLDNGSINRTFLRRQAGQMEIVYGRARLDEGDCICILGQLPDEGQPRYWELTFHDPARTNPARYGDPSDNLLEYNWIEAKLYRIEGGQRQEIKNLRPQEHKLIRYMAQRNRANHDVPVLCSFEEVAGAVWGEEGHPPDADVAHLVWQLRKKIEIDYKNPYMLTTIRGLGYRLQNIRSLPAFEPQRDEQ